MRQRFTLLRRILAGRKWLAAPRSRLRLCLAVTFALLSVAAVAIWMRSYWYVNGVFNPAIQVQMDGGEVAVGHNEVYGAGSYQIGPGESDSNFEHNSPKVIARWTAEVYARPLTSFGLAGFGFGFGAGGWYATVPLWFFALAFGAPAVLLWCGGRFPAGSCRRCGYDLRDSAGRCPECGPEPSATE